MLGFGKCVAQTPLLISNVKEQRVGDVCVAESEKTMRKSKIWNKYQELSEAAILAASSMQFQRSEFKNYLY